MKLSILSENMAGMRFGAEHGISYLFEKDGRKILLDAGHSDLYIRNARLMNIDVDKEVDTVVLSHGHWDHGDGLLHLKGKKLICHPDVWLKRYRKDEKSSEVGLAFSREEALQRFSIMESSQAYEIFPGAWFIGEVPRLNDFESQTTGFKLQDGSDDYVNDDSGLMFVENNKLIIISGCAHSGICNTIEHCKKISGIDEVKVVLGGFHLKKTDNQTLKTIEYLQEQNIEYIYPSHCTDMPALAAFYNAFKFTQLRTGMVFSW